MVNQVAIIVTIAAILISITVTFFPLAQAQGASASSCVSACHEHLNQLETAIKNSKILKVWPAGINMTTGLKHYIIGSPAGVNTTSTSNMTGAAGNMTVANMTVGTHAPSIPSTNPAGAKLFNKL